MSLPHTSHQFPLASLLASPRQIFLQFLPSGEVLAQTDGQMDGSWGHKVNEWGNPHTGCMGAAVGEGTFPRARGWVLSCFTSNGMIVGPSLQSWEHSRVDERLQVVQNLFASFGIHAAHSWMKRNMRMGTTGRLSPWFAPCVDSNPHCLVKHKPGLYSWGRDLV